MYDDAINNLLKGVADGSISVKDARNALEGVELTEAQMDEAINHGVQRLQRRHQLTRGVDLHGQTPTGGRCDTVGQTLSADTQTGEVFRPGGDHAPGNVALGDGGCGQR